MTQECALSETVEREGACMDGTREKEGEGGRLGGKRIITPK